MNCNDDEPIEKMQDNETGEQYLERAEVQLEEYNRSNQKEVDEKK